jgi:hypothetical protein
VIFRVLGRLAWWLLVVVAGWLLARMLRGATGRPAEPETSAPTPMVRDRVCNTFLPRSRALARTVGDEEHFFCSEGCLRSFLDRQVAARRA